MDFLISEDLLFESSEPLLMFEDLDVLLLLRLAVDFLLSEDLVILLFLSCSLGGE